MHLTLYFYWAALAWSTPLILQMRRQRLREGKRVSEATHPMGIKQGELGGDYRMGSELTLNIESSGPVVAWVWDHGMRLPSWR